MLQSPTNHTAFSGPFWDFGESKPALNLQSPTSSDYRPPNLKTSEEVSKTHTERDTALMELGLVQCLHESHARRHA
eukprot:5414061-Amphidinium_carterae.1